MKGFYIQQDQGGREAISIPGSANGPRRPAVAGGLLFDAAPPAAALPLRPPGAAIVAGPFVPRASDACVAAAAPDAAFWRFSGAFSLAAEALRLAVVASSLSVPSEPVQSTQEYYNTITTSHLRLCVPY